MGRTQREETPLGLTSRHRTARSSCMGRSRHSPYSSTPSCEDTGPSPTLLCGSHLLKRLAVRGQPLEATMDHCAPQVLSVRTLTSHPKFIIWVTNGTPWRCSPPHGPPPLPPVRPPARHLTCLSRRASWSWVLPVRRAACPSSSFWPWRCWGPSG